MKTYCYQGYWYVASFSCFLMEWEQEAGPFDTREEADEWMSNNGCVLVLRLPDDDGLE